MPARPAGVRADEWRFVQLLADVADLNQREVVFPVFLTRTVLARRAEKCHDDCPGWAVMESLRGWEVQRCDECCSYSERDEGLLWDDLDVQRLPEARRELKRFLAEHTVEWDFGDEEEEP
jgi:hypothetical protein